MPIRELQFYPEEFYHILNRGNGKQPIFYTDKDRYRFLQAIYISNNANYSVRVAELEMGKSGYTLIEIQKIFENRNIIYDPLVKICIDCLMPNHFHLLLQEIKPSGIVRFMQRLGTGYGKYFTTKYNRPGSLFQGRFKAVHIETDDQLRYILAYINVINPAQLVEPNLKENGIKSFDRVWEIVDKYNWSTHQEFIGRRNSILIDKGLLSQLYPTPKEYEQFVKDVLLSKKRKFWATIDGLTLE